MNVSSIIIISLHRDVPSYHTTIDSFCTGKDGFHDHFRDVSWQVICKEGTTTAASDFSQWGQTGIDVSIQHQNCQVKLHSSQWFLVAFVDVINIDTTSLCVSTNKISGV